MALTKQTCRKVQPNPFPREMLATVAARKNAVTPPVRDISSTSSDSEESQDEASSDFESESEYEKEEDSEHEMPQHEENQNGANNTDLVDRNATNAREVSSKEYNQALKARDLALNQLNSLRAELKLEKKVWEAEKKTLYERLDKEVTKFASELKAVQKSLSKCEAQLERTSQERDSYRNSLELRKKAWEDEKEAMTARLNTAFINFGVEVREVLGMEIIEKENAMESEKKVGEAANIDMAESTEMANRKRKMLSGN